MNISYQILDSLEIQAYWICTFAMCCTLPNVGSEMENIDPDF